MRVCDREGLEKKVTIAKSFIRQVQESGIVDAFERMNGHADEITALTSNSGW